MSAFVNSLYDRNYTSSKPPDGVVAGLYIEDLICQLTFPPFVLMKKWKCRESSFRMCPTLIKLEKYFFYILIAQAYGSISKDDAVISNCNFISNFCVDPRCCFINLATPWSNICCESKSIHVCFVVWFNPDLILTATFRNLTFILNVIVAYISNVTMYISLQMLQG